MTYTATAKISKAEFDRINRLLSIDSLECMTDEELRKAGANTFQNEGIYAVDFGDGSCLTYDLCSGSENYYDNVIWTTPEGNYVNFDCAYDIDDIEFEIGGNTYLVKIEVEG